MQQRWAASVILSDPAQATIPPGDIGPRVVETIRAGAQQAAALKAAGVSLRFAFEEPPIGGFIVPVSREGSDVIRKGLRAAPKKGFTASLLEDLA